MAEWIIGLEVEQEKPGIDLLDSETLSHFLLYLYSTTDIVSRILSI